MHRQQYGPPTVGGDCFNLAKNSPSLALCESVGGRGLGRHEGAVKLKGAIFMVEEIRQGLLSGSHRPAENDWQAQSKKEAAEEKVKLKVEGVRTVTSE